MADPFSILTGTIGVADVLFRLGTYLKHIHRDSATIDETVRELTDEIAALGDIVTAVKRTFQEETDTDISPDFAADTEAVQNLWAHVSKTLQSCVRGVENLDNVVRKIFGGSSAAGPGKIDDLLRAHRKRSRADDIRQGRQQIATHQQSLQLLLAAINLKSGRSAQETSVATFQQFSQELQDVKRNVCAQSERLQRSPTIPGSYEAQLDTATLSAYESLRLSVDSAANAITAVSSNEYFDTPQQVSSIFTGRRTLLDDLRGFLIAPPGISKSAQQRRFVIYGIGGSGKTQFSCKFAEENRDSFWGVFWIDGSSVDRIKQSLANIARIAGVDPNETAALYWLSNIKQRWLLLIDNADDRYLPLEDFFPKGNRGHILVTTRNPAHKLHGNVGPRFYDFEKLEASDATQLLLRAADRQQVEDLTAASTITMALDFLALAIIQAGAAIRQGLCTLENYLPFFERSWKMISHRRRNSDSDIESPVRKVYASWDLNYRHLESNPTQTRQDAIELLKTFAFLHRENIRFDMLQRALSNGELEAQYEERAVGERHEPVSKSKLADWVRILHAMWAFGISSSASPPLPRLLRLKQNDAGDVDAVTALRVALSELVQSSLISHNDINDSYSMHPLQHRYARERLNIGEQGVWAEAAACVLSASILLPPLGDNTECQDFNRQLVPHLDHVMRCRNTVQQAVTYNRRYLWRKWMFPTLPLTQTVARMYAKFSLVYAQTGHWTNAEQLQTVVRNFTLIFLGAGDSKTRLISMALSNTLWNLGRAEEALDMQKDILRICEVTFGPDHLETLKAKHVMGQTLWQKGQLNQARSVQEEVMVGFLTRLGADHELTLKAKDNLGRTVFKFMEETDIRESRRLHTEAMKGMERLHGPDHVETLWAKESLARVLTEMVDGPLDVADELISDVLEKRKSKLGKEHPYTLLAMVNKALTKSARGCIEEAEDLLRLGLEVANRNLGRDHVGTLLGRAVLASVLIQQERYEDAEEILQDTVERQKHMKSSRGNYHPDRVTALVELAKCYRLQGKIESSIHACDEALDGFESFTLVREHVLARDLKVARLRLVRYQEAIERYEPPEENVIHPIPGRYRLYRLF